jgi:alkanesulfonate monooxygenase SsuD/methylene tetrahydromethanopterin reductase-like flavin-dependent oxidoreductase (luciferase family)
VLSENWTLSPPDRLDQLVRFAAIAESAGVDTVMLSEHVVLGADSRSAGLMHNPRDYAAPGNQDPATPWPDSIVLASAIAATTSSLRIALAAVIAPLRHPLLLAKQLATLDLLAGGRLVVQPTVSWSRAEYEALGVDFSARGSILDEQLDAMFTAWVAPPGQPSNFTGRHFSYADVWVEPRTGSPISMWFGGERLHRALIRRIVRYGVGFHPFGRPTPDDLSALRSALGEVGRDPLELELIGGIRGSFGDADSVADLDEALRSIATQRAEGYTSICFKPSMFTDDPSELESICRRVVEELQH